MVSETMIKKIAQEDNMLVLFAGMVGLLSVTDFLDNIIDELSTKGLYKHDLKAANKLFGKSLDRVLSKMYSSDKAFISDLYELQDFLLAYHKALIALPREKWGVMPDIIGAIRSTPFDKLELLPDLIKKLNDI